MKQTEMGSGLRLKVIGVAGVYAALAAFVFFLAFCNLDGRPFWGDEAETALLARNVVKFGVPKVDDGVNHISLHGDTFDARDGVWTWSPWLQDYIVAGSFAVFGKTTWAGRAPFALIGWLAVIALGLVAWQIYRSHRVAFSAMLLLGTSEVFLLHIRQCRYYSITVLAEILLAYGIYQMLNCLWERGVQSVPPGVRAVTAQRAVPTMMGACLILAALLVQFYCNYTCAIANLPILLVLAFKLFSEDRWALRRLLLCFGIFLLFTVPWLLFTEVWRQGPAEGRDTWAHLIRFYAWQFHFHFIPWCFVLLPIGGWAVGRFGGNHLVRTSFLGVRESTLTPALSPRRGRIFRRWFGAADEESGSSAGCAILDPPKSPVMVVRFESYLLGLMILYVPVLLVMPLAFSRYLLPLLPMACLLTAVWVFRYIKWPSMAWIILMVECLTNLPAVATDPFCKQYPVRSPVADVLFSSLLPYEDRFTDLLKYFGGHARPGDTLLSWDPEFPLAFYTHLKVIDGRLTPDPFHPLPNWILPESATGVLNERHELPDTLKSRYEKIILTVHNSTPADTIPEPEAYELQTAVSMSPFVIYKLKNEN
jgi:hypothetical protein